MPAQSDPLGHLLLILNTKVDYLKSSISKKVADDIQSSVPLIIADALKENLPEKFPVFDAQVKQSLQDQLPSILKPMNKHFNAFNTLESRRIAGLCSRTWFPSLKHHKTLKRLMLRGRRGATTSSRIIKCRISPLVNEENVLVLHALVEKSLEVNTSEKKVTDDEPPPDSAKMTIEQVTEHLSKTTSSIFSPTPPKELTLPKDTTPPRDESKEKGIATEEPIKEIMPFMEEGGLAPKMPNFMPFSTLNGQMTNDDVMAQLKEMKRLADLKAEKEKLEKSLKKILNPATIRAQA
ncbi:hypothetical protein Tco_1172513 [Tanacetum coccineum]